MNRFAAALDLALGPAAPAKGGKAEAEWRGVVRAHWINGRARGEQKAIVKSLIRLGLTSQTAAHLATAGHVDATALAAVATKLEQGEPLTEVDLNLLGRLDASIEAQLDAAFDGADQRYRNGSRVLAGILRDRAGVPRDVGARLAELAACAACRAPRGSARADREGSRLIDPGRGGRAARREVSRL